MLASAGSPPQQPYRKILISAGEASGDGYAALLAEELCRRDPSLSLFGCAGPKMRRAGVRAVIRSESLAVVGLVEVLAHIPRIYREYRKLLQAIRDEKPDLAILTDSPDFHLRVARHLERHGYPGGLLRRSPGVGVAEGSVAPHAPRVDAVALHLPV